MWSYPALPTRISRPTTMFVELERRLPSQPPQNGALLNASRRLWTLRRILPTPTFAFRPPQPSSREPHLAFNRNAPAEEGRKRTIFNSTGLPNHQWSPIRSRSARALPAKYSPVVRRYQCPVDCIPWERTSRPMRKPPSCDAAQPPRCSSGSTTPSSVPRAQMTDFQNLLRAPLCTAIRRRSALSGSSHLARPHWPFIQPRPEPSGHLRLLAPRLQ